MRSSLEKQPALSSQTWSTCCRLAERRGAGDWGAMATSGGFGAQILSRLDPKDPEVESPEEGASEPPRACDEGSREQEGPMLEGGTILEVLDKPRKEMETLVDSLDVLSCVWHTVDLSTNSRIPVAAVLELKARMAAEDAGLAYVAESLPGTCRAVKTSCPATRPAIRGGNGPDGSSKAAASCSATMNDRDQEEEKNFRGGRRCIQTSAFDRQKSHSRSGPQDVSGLALATAGDMSNVVPRVTLVANIGSTEVETQGLAGSYVRPADSYRGPQLSFIAPSAPYSVGEPPSEGHPRDHVLDHLHLPGSSQGSYPSVSFSGTLCPSKERFPLRPIKWISQQPHCFVTASGQPIASSPSSPLSIPSTLPEAAPEHVATHCSQLRAGQQSHLPTLGRPPVSLTLTVASPSGCSPSSSPLSSTSPTSPCGCNTSPHHPRPPPSARVSGRPAPRPARLRRSLSTPVGSLHPRRSPLASPVSQRGLQSVSSPIGRNDVPGQPARRACVDVLGFDAASSSGQETDEKTDSTTLAPGHGPAAAASGGPGMRPPKGADAPALLISDTGGGGQGWDVAACRPAVVLQKSGFSSSSRPASPEMPPHTGSGAGTPVASKIEAVLSPASARIYGSGGGHSDGESDAHVAEQWRRVGLQVAAAGKKWQQPASIRAKAVERLPATEVAQFRTWGRAVDQELQSGTCLLLGAGQLPQEGQEQALRGDISISPASPATAVAHSLAAAGAPCQQKPQMLPVHNQHHLPAAPGDLEGCEQERSPHWMHRTCADFQVDEARPTGLQMAEMLEGPIGSGSEVELPGSDCTLPGYCDPQQMGSELDSAGEDWSRASRLTSSVSGEETDDGPHPACLVPQSATLAQDWCGRVGSDPESTGDWGLLQKGADDADTELLKVDEDQVLREKEMRVHDWGSDARAGVRQLLGMRRGRRLSGGRLQERGRAPKVASSGSDFCSEGNSSSTDNLSALRGWQSPPLGLQCTQPRVRGQAEPFRVEEFGRVGLRVRRPTDAVGHCSRASRSSDDSALDSMSGRDPERVWFKTGLEGQRTAAGVQMRPDGSSHIHVHEAGQGCDEGTVGGAGAASPQCQVMQVCASSRSRGSLGDSWQGMVQREDLSGGEGHGGQAGWCRDAHAHRPSENCRCRRGTHEGLRRSLQRGQDTDGTCPRGCCFERMGICACLKIPHFCKGCAANVCCGRDCSSRRNKHWKPAVRRGDTQQQPSMLQQMNCSRRPGTASMAASLVDGPLLRTWHAGMSQCSTSDCNISDEGSSYSDDDVSCLRRAHKRDPLAPLPCGQGGVDENSQGVHGKSCRRCGGTDSWIEGQLVAVGRRQTELHKTWYSGVPWQAVTPTPLSGSRRLNPTPRQIEGSDAVTNDKWAPSSGRGRNTIPVRKDSGAACKAVLADHLGHLYSFENSSLRRYPNPQEQGHL